MDFNHLLKTQAHDFGQKRGLWFEGKSVCFSQLKTNAFAVAGFLFSQKITADDKIALFAGNTDQAVYCFCGIFSLGASVIPFDYMLTQEEIIHLINHSQAKVLIIQPKKNICLKEISAKCLSLKLIITCGEKVQDHPYILEIISQPQPAFISKYQAKNLAAIFYTSGSTGKPKGVMLNYSHLNTPIQSFQDLLAIDKDDIFLCGGVPFSHLGGMDYILAMVYFGLTLILQPRFNPLEFLKAIQEHKVSVFCIVPAMYVAILSLKDYESFDLSSLRYAAVFGAPSSPILLNRFRQLCPKAMLINGWGMTETSAPNTFSPADFSKISSIGSFSSKMSAKIVDDELWVKGQGVMAGYYKDLEMTKEVLTDDGWLKTGDIVRKDQDGLFYIVGRKKDMLKVAGEIVFTAEVEEKIQEHPAVKETAVIGVKDKLRGEVPKAFISCKLGQVLDSQTLRDYLKPRLAHFKIPHYFEFIDDLPKNRVGKIDKNALLKMPNLKVRSSECEVPKVKE